VISQTKLLALIVVGFHFAGFGAPVTLPPFKLSVSVAGELQSKVKSQGRLVLYLSPYNGAGKVPLYGDTKFMLACNVSNWNTQKPIVVRSTDKNVRTFGLDINLPQPNPEKLYHCKLLYKQDNDGTEKFAPVAFTGEIEAASFKSRTTVHLALNREAPALKIQPHRFVKEIDMRSELLSKFFGQDYHLKASVLLPGRFWDHPEEKYPALFLVSGLNGRHDQVNHYAQNADFMKWWLSPAAPQIINVFLDSKGPYGDTYQMDSENSGPFGSALTRELIPFVERECRGMGTPQYRFLDGASTGGWVVLALQIFYPDYFNGAWAYSPDPVDFEHFGLIDIYHDESAFFNRFDYLQPEARSIYGEPKGSMRDAILEENLLGPSNTYATSGKQFGAYNAVFSPRDKDGLPALMFDPLTGKINRQVAEKWKRWDLKYYLQQNWETVGPKLQGKLWAWCGDMDSLYSNVALRFFQKFIEGTTQPKSDAQIVFTPMAGHCAAFSHKDVLLKVAEKVQRLKEDQTRHAEGK